MIRFLQGALSVLLLWVSYEWFRNPHGHRGGLSEEPDEGPFEGEYYSFGGKTYFLPGHYGRTG